MMGAPARGHRRGWHVEKLMSTRKRWDAAFSALGLPPPGDAIFDDLMSRYAPAHRAYHNIDHIRECFEQFDAAQHLAERPAEIEIAIWFHDAVYDPRSSDNEERSADLAASSLVEAKASSEVSKSVRDLVLATKHDASPAGADASLLVDVDLSILGAEAARFDEYEAQVREEYSWVPEPAFREGRVRILTAFLARPHIYATEDFRARLEERARGNIERSLGKLGSPSGKAGQ